MKQISKKILSLALVAMLSLSLCAVALAEENTPGGTPSTENPDVGPVEKPDIIPSPENPDTSEPDKGTISGDLSAGNTLSSVTVNGVNVMDKVTLKTVSPAFFATISNADRVKNIFNDFGIAFDTATYLASVDITYDGVIPKSGITFTFDIEGVTKNDAIYAIHQKHDGTYEVVKCTVPQDGKVSITLYTLSPVSFNRLEGARSTASRTNKNVLSPKTGEF